MRVGRASDHHAWAGPLYAAPPQQHAASSQLNVTASADGSRHHSELQTAAQIASAWPPADGSDWDNCGRTAELAARKTDAAGLTCRSTRGVRLQYGPLSADTGARVSGKEMSEATVCCGGGQRATNDRLVAWPHVLNDCNALRVLHIIVLVQAKFG